MKEPGGKHKHPFSISLNTNCQIFFFHLYCYISRVLNNAWSRGGSSDILEIGQDTVRLEYSNGLLTFNNKSATLDPPMKKHRRLVYWPRDNLLTICWEMKGRRAFDRPCLMAPDCPISPPPWTWTETSTLSRVSVSTRGNKICSLRLIKIWVMSQIVYKKIQLKINTMLYRFWKIYKLLNWKKYIGIILISFFFWMHFHFDIIMHKNYHVDLFTFFFSYLSIYILLQK